MPWYDGGCSECALSERNQVDNLSSDLADLQAQLATATEVVVVGGGPLTARQEEMVALVTGPWNEAWIAADGEAVASLFTPEGVQYDFEGGEVLTIPDGTIESFGSSWQGLHVLPSMLVHDDRMFIVVELAGHQVGTVLDFTESGELLIESAAMYDSALGPNG